MGAGRVEAFSDGVIAVILTIMVLELKAPSNGEFAGLLALKLPLLNYLLSFVVIAIMWVNHRPLLKMARHINAQILWANNMLLFWMSLIPFVTAYMGQTNAAPLAVAVYGGVLAVTAASFTVLRLAIAAQHKTDETLARLHKRAHVKSTFGTLLYAASIPLAFVSVRSAFCIFILIPALYFLPESKLAPERD